MANLYLASPGDYLIGADKKEGDALFGEFKKLVNSRYGLPKHLLDCSAAGDSLALYALKIIENGEPEIVEKALKEAGE
jgi:hypothetical protein